ncbi:MAG TPA: molybdenum cofactor biosynthesis protein MoaE [Acetobacteraceae bacterium]|nr:molybdenum cofactor biosynthesis protein MoaE [Acetobacteraceae bacterium]
MAVLTDRPFAADEELARFSARQSGAGAIVSFTGIARPRDRAGDAVVNLFLEHHPRLTLRSIEQIAAEARERFDVTDVHIVHRCGDIAPGEPIVFVATASAHRRAAFEAVDYLMDRLKSEAVFWKREDRAGGSEWIEPTEADARDLARWSD